MCQGSRVSGPPSPRDGMGAQGLWPPFPSDGMGLSKEASNAAYACSQCCISK